MEVLLLVVSLLVAAFAAGAETALTSVSRIRIRTLAEGGNKLARRVIRLHADPNSYLSTILTLNTVAVIVASTVAALLAVNGLGSWPTWLVTIVLSIFVLIFCEIAPKSLALRYNEPLALILAIPVSILVQFLRPIVWALTMFSRALISATTPGKAPPPFLTEEELKTIVSVGEREGVVEFEEREMIHGIFEMTDKPVREIMVPRIDVVAIGTNQTVADYIQLIIDHGHSRIPVFEGTIDNIIGVLYAKDMLRHGVRSETLASLQKLARPAYFTPESTKAGELLQDMQGGRVHLAIVVDEYGGTAGIVTIEDLIEEIVGPIRDEYDSLEVEDVQVVSDREAIVNARMPLEDFSELLGIKVGHSESDSIGGLFYEKLGDIPTVGSSIEIDGATLKVETLRRKSIQTIRVIGKHPLPKQVGEPKEASDTHVEK